MTIVGTRVLAAPSRAQTARPPRTTQLRAVAQARAVVKEARAKPERATGTMGTRRTARSNERELALVSSVCVEDAEAGVCISIEASMADEDEVRVLWGVYRASPDAWQFPKAVEAAETFMDEGMGAMSTAMQRGEACHVAQFQIPSKAAPLTFAYALHARRGEQWRVVTPARGGHFTVQIGVQEGSAGKLGPSLTEDGTLNFAVECRGGDYVNLVLVRATSDGPEASGASGAAGVKLEEFALDPSTNRTGVVWHAAVRDTGDIVGYGWRVNGDLGWEQGARVVPDTVLVDPEAPRVKFFDPCDALAVFPCIKTRTGEDAVVVSGIPTERAHRLSPRTRPSLVVGGSGMISVDTASFGHEIDGVRHPGTFLGLSEAAPHFLALGVKAVVVRHPYALTDGRALSFFAPDPSLAASGDTEDEFKLMVDSLHSVGIRVLMSIDLTLTAEGSDEDPKTISWRGLDNANYYRANGVFNCGNPVAQEHVIRALRHWTLHMGVDGFEFVFAENMTQNMDEVVMDAPALPDALAHDPVLASTMLIASPSDEKLLPRQGERGFPHWGKWLESNGQKAMALHYFLSPTHDLMLAMAASIAGRPHLFSPAYHGFPGCLSTKRPVKFSVNALNAWDAAAVSSSASSARARMLASGLEEGLSTTDSVSRAILAAILLSSGTPSIPSEAVGEGTLEFVKGCLTCRPILGRVLDSGSVGTWHGPNGHIVSLDFAAGDQHFLGRLVSCHAGALYVALNPESDALFVNLPGPPGPQGSWKLVIDSYTGEVCPSGLQISTDGWKMPGKSVALFMAATLEAK